MLVSPRPEVVKLFVMLNSAEHEINLLINVKVPTILIVGILTFMRRMNFIKSVGLFTITRRMNFMVGLSVPERGSMLC